MPDTHVIHNTLGAARLLRKLDNGRIWEVRLDQSGRRFRLPAAEFESSASLATANDLLVRFHHRQTLEALRMGIVPIEDVREMTIGLEPQKLTLQQALERSQEFGGDALAVLADYGFGKSHFIELAAQNALAKNFLVASASLDLVEVPPGKAREVYKALVSSIRYPGSDELGLTRLLAQALDQPEILHNFIHRKPIPDCPLSEALLALANCDDPAAHDGIVAWLSGAVTTLNSAAKVYLKHAPRLYLNGEVARQYTYLMTGISVLAAMLGYSGLVVLIDESEHYSLLKGTQHLRAESLFKSLIYAATAPTNQRIDIDIIPNHTRADYPITFATPNNLFFMFASTDAEGNRLPVESWLSPSQQMRLDGRFIKSDVFTFAKTVLRYHGVAYNYSPAENRYKVLLENSSTILSRALSQNRINLRQLIKLTVTICDLMFTYADYLPDQLLDELKNGLGN